jgi:DNA invertase Pin-like site-specific DNA recombinase
MALGGTQFAVDGYVRVSRVGRRKGERFISPSVQREVIAGWAAANDVRVLQVFEELDRSGRGGRQPLLDEAVRRVEDGLSEGIVVAKVTRFGRSMLAGIAAIERVTRAGGRFVAVENNLDTSTDSGRLMLHILLSMAESDGERIGADWEHARAHAIRRGVYMFAGSPVGYRKTRSGRLRPDPPASEAVAEAFRRRVDGESFSSLGRWFEELGIRTAYGNAGWAAISMSNVLRSRVYLGELTDAGYVNEHAHPPLVDPATWEAAQHPRRVVAPREPAPALLTRLVRCAGCSLVMTPYRHHCHGNGLEVVYRCTGHSAAGRCPAPASIDAVYLEPYVEECVFDILRRRRREPAATLERAEREARAASASLARYRDSDRILDTLGMDAYLAGVAARSERARDARLQLAAVRDTYALHALPATRDLERQWPALTDPERRAWIAQVIDCVFVSAGELHIEDRVIVCRAGTAPKLPRRGPYRGGEARPFTPSARHRLPLPKPWPTARIERELADYLRGQRVWPTPAQFAAAGHRRLHDQVVRHSCVTCWAHHFGLPILFEVRSREAWTDARIRAALQLYLRRKRSFPSQHEFERDGLGGLHHAMRQTGGVRRWSAEFPLPLRPGQRRPLPASATGQSTKA